MSLTYRLPASPQSQVHHPSFLRSESVTLGKMRQEKPETLVTFTHGQGQRATDKSVGSSLAYCVLSVPSRARPMKQCPSYSGWAFPPQLSQLRKSRASPIQSPYGDSFQALLRSVKLTIKTNSRALIFTSQNSHLIFFFQTHQLVPCRRMGCVSRWPLFGL